LLSVNQPIRYALTMALGVAVCDAAARGLVPRGRYEIIVTQELPNVSKAGEPIRLEECLTKSSIASAAAFHVRSDNPIRQCPISGVRFNGEELLYRIVCPQPNAPSAKAKFVYTPTGYEGAISINMGGKNMILTERHRAQRIGECPGDVTDSNVHIDEQHWRGEPLRAQPHND
jgi:hypothetical protein